MAPRAVLHQGLAAYLPVYRAVLYTFTQKCLPLGHKSFKSLKLSCKRVLLREEMRPNIKFDLIGLKLAEISSFENQYFCFPKKALQAGNVQVSQILAPNVEKCNLGIV